MYVLITSVVLLLLNLYAARTTEVLTLRSKSSMMKDKALLASGALSEADVFTGESAAQILGQMGSLNASRIIATDPSGKVLFDSMHEISTVGSYALLPEIVSALEGYDATQAYYRQGTLETAAASPVVHKGALVGAVYLTEYDNSEQAQLIAILRKNILTMSIILEVAVVLFSAIFAEVFSLRLRKIFASIRIIREGDYSHKMHLRGNDELAVLGAEFNDLTDRLQASEKRRRQFVSDASHELKTPLASIKLLSDSILQNEMDPATIREFVEDIGGEADRLTRMSQKLLSLSRMDAGNEDERALVDVGETANRVLRMLSPVAKLHEVTLKNMIPAGLTVLVLEDDLYQILFNLSENGIKYNKPGGSLTLSCQKLEDEVQISVADTGVGIPSEAVPYVFERFYRVDKARSRQAGGSGLGLSIVHDMVKRNYGTIRVSPGKEGGTVFEVTLPLLDIGDEL